MHETDFDPASLRDWMAGVGLLRLASEVSTHGRGYWAIIANRYRFVIKGAPEDFPALCSAWVSDHRADFDFGGADNVNFDDAFWRRHAASAMGLASELWAAIASDGVWHREGKKLQANGLEYGHGGGHQHWLASMRSFVARGLSPEAFSSVLRSERNEAMDRGICRWDPACERDHAYRAIAPAADRMAQDQTINALAAIGLASCPSAPTRGGLKTPLVRGRGILEWPVWTEPLRSAELEAALCCGWNWPTMQSVRYISDRLFRFSRGSLREPEASHSSRGRSRKEKSTA